MKKKDEKRNVKTKLKKRRKKVARKGNCLKMRKNGELGLQTLTADQFSPLKLTNIGTRATPRLITRSLDLNRVHQHFHKRSDRQEDQNVL